MSALINRCCWIGWVVGAILIVLSWVDIVSVETGWIGFGMATAGWLLSRTSHAIAPADDSSATESEYDEPEGV